MDVVNISVKEKFEEAKKVVVETKNKNLDLSRGVKNSIEKNVNKLTTEFIKFFADGIEKYNVPTTILCSTTITNSDADEIILSLNNSLEEISTLILKTKFETIKTIVMEDFLEEKLRNLNLKNYSLISVYSRIKDTNLSEEKN